MSKLLRTMDSPADVRSAKLLQELIVTSSFIVGTVGNIAALCILYRSAKVRNKKHVFMLTCLALNDLVAEVGMLVILNLKKLNLVPMQWICVGYVLLRAFGLGSGCVAFIMAVERWLALTKPFLYHQFVTYETLKKCMLVMWGASAFWTYLPLLGFGLYYKDNQCFRYRNASVWQDQIYAYIFLGFGSTMCICIALLNLTLMCQLTSYRVLIRRNSRLNSKRYQTPDELAFAKLMAWLCAIFLVCWAPQMISIPLAQFHPESSFVRSFSNMADILMCVYFTLDPYVYVLFRYIEQCCPTKRSPTPTSGGLNPPSNNEV